jgi:hypothetical protein
MADVARALTDRPAPVRDFRPDAIVGWGAVGRRIARRVPGAAEAAVAGGALARAWALCDRDETAEAAIMLLEGIFWACGPPLPGFYEFVARALGLARERDDVAMTAFRAVGSLAKKWPFAPEALPEIVRAFDEYAGPDVDHSHEGSAVEEAAVALGRMIGGFPDAFGDTLGEAIVVWVGHLSGEIWSEENAAFIIRQIIRCVRAEVPEMLEEDQVATWLSYVARTVVSFESRLGAMLDVIRTFFDEMDAKTARLIVEAVPGTINQDVWMGFCGIAFRNAAVVSPIRQIIMGNGMSNA